MEGVYFCGPDHANRLHWKAGECEKRGVPFVAIQQFRDHCKVVWKATRSTKPHTKPMRNIMKQIKSMAVRCPGRVSTIAELEGGGAFSTKDRNNAAKCAKQILDRLRAIDKIRRSDEAEQARRLAEIEEKQSIEEMETARLDAEWRDIVLSVR